MAANCASDGTYGAMRRIHNGKLQLFFLGMAIFLKHDSQNCTTYKVICPFNQNLVENQNSGNLSTNRQCDRRFVLRKEAFQSAHSCIDNSFVGVTAGISSTQHHHLSPSPLSWHGAGTITPGFCPTLLYHHVEAHQQIQQHAPLRAPQAACDFATHALHQGEIHRNVMDPIVFSARDTQMVHPTGVFDQAGQHVFTSFASLQGNDIHDDLQFNLSTAEDICTEAVRQVSATNHAQISFDWSDPRRHHDSAP